MLNTNNKKTTAVLSLLLGTLTITPLLSIAPIVVKSAQAQQYNQYAQAVLPVGTTIPVRYEKEKRILMAKNETIPLTLEVAQDIRDRTGKVVIPTGSKIAGELQPYGQGARFVAKKLTFKHGNDVWLNATSNVVTRTETIKKGANPTEILGGTVAGAGAAAIISGLTGDRNINALEVLSGAAIGTIAGWALPTTGVIGGGSKEVLAIAPRRDLTLTLRSNLYVDKYDYR
ncbi:hypothetical protein C7H19_15610 [Aphanothece hegewaldii CCALA 016]|uniref:Uncharacterized protein n=1 Tax=Aphanothece hegewaldii CCALA 016 TaxID=2107694 RepID=A0A2T1LVC6_9CHRO|nr:hypothetical protein [Aphanothece hegewaldii]PSF35667.1 hypothetical protein C7H19_15610 [Aphanothece hegewaldii CCALA 016]